MILEYLQVLKNTEIAAGIYKTVFSCGDNMPEIAPGQFINIYPKSPLLTLPRPISVCDVESGKLTVVYRVVGKGTEEFSLFRAGESVKVMCPLGNGFDIAANADGQHILIGGGLGAPPLLYLARKLAESGTGFSVFLGYADEIFLVDEFRKYTDNIFISTESGAYGEKGNVLDILKKQDCSRGVFYACGPLPMLKAVCAYAAENGSECMVSLEQRMACGFGACIGCAVKIKRKDQEEWQYLKACKDGPVFDGSEVVF